MFPDAMNSFHIVRCYTDTSRNIKLNALKLVLRRLIKRPHTLHPVLTYKATHDIDKSRENMLCEVFCKGVFEFRLNVPVNNFSVMSGRRHRFLGITITLWEVDVSCSRIQHGDPSEDQTPDLSLQSPMLYHQSTAPLCFLPGTTAV